MRDWELDELVNELRRRHATLIAVGRRDDQLDAFAAVLTVGPWWDVVAVRAEHRASAHRTPADPATDPLNPGAVVWHYLGSTVWTLRAVLTLPDHSAWPICIRRRWNAWCPNGTGRRPRSFRH